MLLTIKQSTHQPYKSFHDYTPPTPPSTSRFSPAVVATGASVPFAAATHNSLPPLSSTKSLTEQMSTHHRGLPPPVGLSLPAAQQPLHQPAQQPLPLGQPSLNQPIGQLPAPPQQWQGAEESMRNWLHAKAEEDKRKQEEEKTRQESLRLEQRKIEQDMLRTSLSGGIPPYMIPMVFAGMGGGNLPNASLEWAQHYIAQSQNFLPQQQIQQQPLLASSQSMQSPEQIQRRDSRAAAPAYSQQQAPLTVPSTPVGSSSQHVGGFLPGQQGSPGSRNRQIAQGKIGIQTQVPQLPRINTGEIHIQPPPAGPGIQILPGQGNHPLQQSHTPRQQESQSPSIYFHHWQPPTSQAGTTQASTSSANQPTPPSDHTNSPKKRKATGPQQAAPPPASQPQYTSPSFSQPGSSVSSTPQSQRRGHSRQRSDLSSGSRHRHAESGFSVQSQEKHSDQGRPVPIEPQRSSGHSVSSLLEHSDTRPQPRQALPTQQSPQYSAGPEMRHEERRISPDGEELRRTKIIKRDDSRN